MSLVKPIEVRRNFKLKKYCGHLIYIYWELHPLDLQHKYGVKIYQLRPENQRKINPKIQDCYFPCPEENCFFGFSSDRQAIAFATNFIQKEVADSN